jgi:hypothetical protein
MAAVVVRFEYEGETLYSPFSGKRTESGSGPNKRDKTLLFVHYGDCGEYGYISRRVREALKPGTKGDPEALAPVALARKLDLPFVLVFEVDAGWNGVNTYAFAPTDE